MSALISNTAIQRTACPIPVHSQRDNRMKQIFISMLVLLSLSGCREYHYYRYTPVVQNVLGGRLVIDLEGSYNDVEEKRTDMGAPYTLRFRLSMPYDEYNMTGIEVTNISLTGVKSKNTVLLRDTKSRKVRDPRKHDPYATDRSALATIRNLGADKIAYESYELKAKLIVHDGDSNTRREQQITVPLNTDFDKEYRSDWLDHKLGV